VTSVEGLTMPVFTFEKISSPTHRVSDSSSASEKPRGVLTQLFDRFTEARARRTNPDGEVVQPEPRKSAK
jgi:hypothetical protein